MVEIHPVSANGIPWDCIWSSDCGYQSGQYRVRRKFENSTAESSRSIERVKGSNSLICLFIGFFLKKDKKRRRVKNDSEGIVATLRDVCIAADSNHHTTPSPQLDYLQKEKVNNIYFIKYNIFFFIFGWIYNFLSAKEKECNSNSEL